MPPESDWEGLPVLPEAAPVLETPLTPSPRPWGFWCTLLFGGLIAFAWGVAQGGTLLVTWAVFPHHDADLREHAGDGDILSIITLLSGTAALILIALISSFRNWHPAKYLGYDRWPRLWPLAGWTALTLAFGTVHSYFGPMFGVKSPPEFMITAWKSTDSWILLFAAITLMAPLFEETFFRGFLFSGWRHTWMKVPGAAIVTSLLWTSLHIQYGPYELSYILVLGILLAVARVHTGSIWTPLLMHAANNGIACAGMFWEPR
jgi:membrane protease YdiL (CAAX protease family)